MDEKAAGRAVFSFDFHEKTCNIGIGGVPMNKVRMCPVCSSKVKTAVVSNNIKEDVEIPTLFRVVVTCPKEGREHILDVSDPLPKEIVALFAEN